MSNQDKWDALGGLVMPVDPDPDSDTARLERHRRASSALGGAALMRNPHVEAQADRMRQAALIVSAALGEVERILEEKTGRAPTYRNSIEHGIGNHGLYGERNRTRADDKRVARAVARQLRDAWEILDPTGQ